jgi:hypothetical protein
MGVLGAEIHHEMGSARRWSSGPKPEPGRHQNFAHEVFHSDIHRIRSSALTTAHLAADRYRPEGRSSSRTHKAPKRQSATGQGLVTSFVARARDRGRFRSASTSRGSNPHGEQVATGGPPARKGRLPGIRIPNDPILSSTKSLWYSPSENAIANIPYPPQHWAGSAGRVSVDLSCSRSAES